MAPKNPYSRGEFTKALVLNALLDIMPFAQGRDRLQQSISRLIADGGTSYYDATIEGFEAVRARRNQGHINAVVLLTDGEDTDSQKNVDAVVQQLNAQGDTTNRVRVFTIAYSAGAQGAADALKRIAAASGGNSYTGDAEDIETVYRSISSFF